MVQRLWRQARERFLPTPPIPRPPDFICIGAQKAATTWLQANLVQHPKVALPFAKELHFFDSRHGGNAAAAKQALRRRLDAWMKRPLAFGMAPVHRTHLQRLADPTRMFTPEWYLDVFALTPPGRLTGEFTPSYAALPEQAIEEVFQIAPKVKLIYLIRDPYDRALSSYRMALQRRRVDVTNPAAVDAAAHQWLGLRGKAQGNYAGFIPRWDAYTTEGVNILYLPFGDVKSDPSGVLDRVEAYLGLSPGPRTARSETAKHPTLPAPVPAWLEDRLRTDMAPHRAFLEKRFSADFVSRIR